jgi:alpha-ketoglutarate-dependent taurine dioxygenase
MESKLLPAGPRAARRAIDSSASSLVRFIPPPEAQSLPLTITPAQAGVDLPAWARGERSSIERLLLKYGGLLFRGFDIGEQTDLEQFTNAIGIDLMHYMEGATPRHEVGDHVYTSTEFPPEHRIALHNELSYVLTWPMRICFFCVIAPQDRGETPIADVRRVYRRIDPEVRGRFEQRGWMLVRNFGEGFSLPWQSVYRTNDRQALEEYSLRARIDVEWRGEAKLRTRQVRPATAVHPRTGETVWFNHAAFWHASSLDPAVRKSLSTEFADDELPYNTFYGDGSPIEDAVMEHIREAYDQETFQFRWQPGDLLLLDNMLAAHGRSPFSGPRRILVSMGDPFTRGDF